MVECLVLGPLGTNCYVLASAGEAIVIDPADDPEQILRRLHDLDLKLRGLVTTHGHFDHIGAIPDLMAATGVPLWIHSADISLLRSGGFSPDGTSSLSLPLGLPAATTLPPQLPQDPTPLADGDQVVVGKITLEVIHTPGHTQGSICLYAPPQAILFSGDTLFQLGVGRADLPGGNGRALLRSIKERLFVLPDETTVYPGHGPSTTIGQEKRRNPFVRAIYHAANCGDA